jgi:hypothetical protein
MQCPVTSLALCCAYLTTPERKNQAQFELQQHLLQMDTVPAVQRAKDLNVYN